MNILHSIGSLDQRSGGPLRLVLDLSANATEHGIRSEILGSGPVRIADNPMPIELIHSLPIEGITSYVYSPVVRHWCRENLGRFDVVILHGLWSATNWTVSRECIAANTPYIVFPHGMLDTWPLRRQGWFKWIKKALYWYLRDRRLTAGSHAVFFTTQRELDDARLTFHLPKITPFVVAPYGVSHENENVDAKPSVSVDQGAERKIALFLGRVHPIKRLDILIESWANADVPSNWRLVIAGPGEPVYLAQLEALARRCGIEDAVQFVGPVAGTDKRYLFQRSRWFLLPSEHENFGVAVLEAEAGRCALAISEQVYFADELPDGTDVLPVSEEAWTRFMRERMTDDTWHDETVRRVREHLGDRFSAEHVANEWIIQVERVINNQR